MSYSYPYSVPTRGTRKAKAEDSYLIVALIALVFVLIVEHFWPEVIPFTFLQFWHLNGSLGDVLGASWMIFVWGAVATIALSLIRRERLSQVASELSFGEVFFVGALISAFAGIFEEIAFRWLIFFNAITGLTVSNWLLGGFAGHGVFQWFYTTIAIPLANFTTMGILAPVLFGGFSWAVGAALITSNGKFRNGHIYQGPIGWVNSWFLGMFFFYLMFQYGLFAAILVHFLYDLVVFTALGSMIGILKATNY